MRKHLIGALCCALPLVSCSQTNTTQTPPPQTLLYDESTMRQLHHIVDSLNLKFKACELNRSYYAIYQGVAHYVYLDTGSVKKAKMDLERQMPFEQFIQKYPLCEVQEDLLVIRTFERNDEQTNIIEFNNISLDGSYGEEISFSNLPADAYLENMTGKWVFHYSKGSKYHNEFLEGFFFTTDLNSLPLPEKYARMVQYADCMVDTSSDIFREEAHSDMWVGDLSYMTDKSSKVFQFMDYVNRETHKPKLENGNHDEYWKQLQTWDSLRVIMVADSLSKTPEFQRLLSEAVAQAFEQGGSADSFEEYVAEYYSKKDALELKRRRIVIGQCSQDKSPIEHAFNIAVLSAQTANWEVFLRAHLNIMNDRFQRLSDGSYAWEQRKTYIRELEALDINVPDLLFGISLRIENPVERHYFGSIRRVGRALSETAYPDEIENRMLSMIEDDGLDDYNRILTYFLFLNYNGWLEDEKRKKENIAKLRKSVVSLPDYLKKQIAIEE